MKLSVGDKLFYVPGARLGNSEYVTITKMGRKYGYFGRDKKFLLDDLSLDGRGSLYLNKCDYDRKVETGRLLLDVQKCFDLFGGKSQKLNLDQLKRIKSILDEVD